MASENKKKKAKNSFTHHWCAMLEKDGRLKRLFFYNASLRKKLKFLLKKEEENGM